MAQVLPLIGVVLGVSVCVWAFKSSRNTKK